MNGLDILLILIFVAICGWAIYQRFLRQLMSVAVLYVATVAAGLGYPYVARFATVIGAETTLGQMIVFWVVFAAVAVALEALLRKGFSDVRLPKIGFLDNLFAVVPGIVCGVIIVTLVLTSLGFSTTESWGEALSFARQGVFSGYNGSGLRPLLSQLLRLYLDLHVLWLSPPTPLIGFALP